MSVYKVSKLINDPNKMGDKKEIVVYKIYRGSSTRKGGTLVGQATYRPSFYKSQYSIEYYPKTFPKAIRDYLVKRDGARELTMKYSAGGSAKNPTAVLKQFKARYEGMQETLMNNIKRGKKAKSKLARGLKKTGLTPAQYEQLGKYKVYLEDNKKDIKACLVEIKRQRRYIEIHRQNIARWTKKIKDLKK
jgi:hypothetical protein